MNLREVVRSGYKIFSRMNPEKQKAHILAVQYIELLANQTNTKMEPWDLLKVFGTGKGNELQTDKKEINKIFFARLEEIKAGVPAQVFALEERVTAEIDRLSRGLIDRETTRLRNSRDQEIRNAHDRMNQAQGYLTNAARFESEIMALERRESTIPAQICQIVQENFWDFHQLTGSNLELVTKNDVILTHKNPAANLDLRVNFGKLKTILNLQSMALSVLQHERNIVVSGYYHPHISTGASICWGTAAGVATQKLPKGEIADVLRLLASVLTNYNDSNPYINLARFQEFAKNDAPPKDAPAPIPPGFATAPTIEPMPMPAGLGESPPQRDPQLMEALRSGAGGGSGMPGTFTRSRLPGEAVYQMGMSGGGAGDSAARQEEYNRLAQALDYPTIDLEAARRSLEQSLVGSSQIRTTSDFTGVPDVNLDNITLTVRIDNNGNPVVTEERRS